MVISCLEHNAVTRPLQAMTAKGISFTEVEVVPGDNNAIVNAFRGALRSNTRLIVCTQASNVIGVRLPVERLAALGHEVRDSNSSGLCAKRRCCSHSYAGCWD